MEIIEFKIRRFKELIKGILLGDGTRWSFVRLNVVDYVLDGFQFTNKSHVTNSNWINKDTILYKILSIKNDSNDILSMIDLNILDDDTLMYSFLKEKNILIGVSLHRDDVFYVGKVKTINLKSFVLDTYDAQLKKSGDMTIEFNKVRFIQIHTDYLDSLSLLLDNNK